MSVLSKIRSRAGLLVAVIGIALFAFILGDIFTSGRSVFSAKETNVGVIGGEEVSIMEFEKKVQEQLETMKKNNPNQPIDEAKTDQVVQTTWNQTINEKIFNREFAKVGVSVTGDELTDQMEGKDPNPVMNQYFSDQKTGQIIPQYARPDGKLNVKEVRKYVAGMNEEAEKSWVMLEKYVRETRKQAKYMNLIKKGLYVTTAQAKHDSADASSIYSIRYIAKKFNTAPDSTIQVTDADLLTWYNAHQYRFKVKEPVRSIEFVNFEITPTRKDINELKGDMNNMVAEFKTKTGKDDSAFVQGESDTRNYATKLLKRSQLTAGLDTVFPEAEAGTVVGPVQEGNKMMLYKLISKETSSDSAKVRHILIGYKSPSSRDSTVRRTKAEAKLRADSVLALIKSKKKKMEDLVETYTDDGGSKNPATKEGEMGYHGIYGWYTNETGFAPAFKEFGLNGKKGDVAIVETEFGYHIMEILDKTRESPKYKVVSIERQVQPSKATIDSVYLKANTFAGKNTTSELFAAAVVKDGLNKRMASDIHPTDHAINGLESPKELVRWVFADERKKGDVSQPFQLGERFVVASLTAVKEKGIADLASVKDKVEQEVKKEKKAEKFIELFTKEGAGVTKIEDLAAKLREPAQVADNVNFANSFIPGVGQEYDLIGFLTGAKEGSISKPIKGNNGVYVVSVQKIAKNPATPDSKTLKKQNMASLQSRVDQDMFEALKENAGIKDNRAKFF